jgi:hypothetical protein
MLGPDGFLPNGEGALVEGLRLGVLALVEVERAEIVKGRGERCLIFGPGLLADGEGPLVERFGFGVLVPGMADGGQVVEDGGDAGMLGPSGLLGDGEGPLVERLRLVRLPVGVVEAGERVQALSSSGNKLDIVVPTVTLLGWKTRRSLLPFRPSTNCSVP